MSQPSTSSPERAAHDGVTIPISGPEGAADNARPSARPTAEVKADDTESEALEPEILDAEVIEEAGDEENATDSCEVNVDAETVNEETMDAETVDEEKPQAARIAGAKAASANASANAKSTSSKATDANAGKSADGNKASDAKPDADAESDAEAKPEVTIGEVLDAAKAEVDTAKAEVDAAKAETQEWQDKYLRLHAEWDTYRRRTEEQRSAEKARAAESLVTSLLPVLDDFERSIDYATENGEAGLLEGVQAVHTKFIDVLVKDGVEIIDPKGEPFDALEAQAVATVDDASVPEETVADVYQRGYKMGKKVLRPAMVTVTSGGPKREKPQEDDEQ